jgi:hypothetical protein
MLENTFPKPYNDAMRYVANREYGKAAELLLKLTGIDVVAPFAYFQLANISNITGNPIDAKDLYYKVLEMQPDFCRNLLPEGHANKGYVYPVAQGHKDVHVPFCALCGKPGKPRWAYFLPVYNASYVRAFAPVRVWMYCDDCHHMYAEHFPAMGEIYNTETLTPNATVPFKFSFYAGVVTKLRQCSQGERLLEVGVGGAECSLAALEMGCDVLALDIFAPNIVQAKAYGINAQIMDVCEFKSDEKWDMIVMGDVIEHVSDPVHCMKTVSGLLTENGAVWLSTPNFDGSFARYAGHNDPMRMEASNKNYFSRHSLFALLEKCGLMPIDFAISAYYNGSMEIIAVKSSASCLKGA